MRHRGPVIRPPLPLDHHAPLAMAMAVGCIFWGSTHADGAINWCHGCTSWVSTKWLGKWWGFRKVSSINNLRVVDGHNGHWNHVASCCHWWHVVVNGWGAFGAMALPLACPSPVRWHERRREQMGPPIIPKWWSLWIIMGNEDLVGNHEFWLIIISYSDTHFG